MDVHAITSDGMDHILSVHSGQGDDTPLQMISAQQLAHYRSIEAAHRSLLARLGQPSSARLDDVDAPSTGSP